jgi:hypothetical protein
MIAGPTTGPSIWVACFAEFDSAPTRRRNPQKNGVVLIWWGKRPREPESI